MVEETFDKLLSLDARGKFGVGCEIGVIMPGGFYYGDEPPLIPSLYGAPIPTSGVFQHRHKGASVGLFLLRHFIPKNPRTEEQQANRQKYADGIVAWQALTTIQKEVYNKRSQGKKMTGFNLFLREYLKSH
jgi:hypothetical protein